MDKKQRVIVVLLIIAIAFSLTSIAISLSLGTSPIEFRVITNSPSYSGGNVGLIIDENLGVDNGNR